MPELNVDTTNLHDQDEAQLEVPKSQVVTDNTLLYTPLILNAKSKLSELLSPNGKYIWASDSANFKYAFFGRDTETVVENLARITEYRELSIKWLISLAQHQGIKHSVNSDEKPGALPHEIRSLVMDGQAVNEKAQDLFNTLRPRWSDNPDTDTVVYFGELDGPARFVKACAVLSSSGVNIAEVEYTHIATGETRTLLDACRYAINYIQDRRNESDLDLVEIQPPQNVETLTNQTLKDSKPAYLHKINKKPVLANRFGPRAPLEAQLLSYEALLAYASLIADTNLAEAASLRLEASSLRANTLEHFTIIDQGTKRKYLAAMIDRDPTTGKLRRLNTYMSDAAEGLNGEFFKGDDEETIELRQSIISTIMSESFLTNGGIRCRDLNDNGLFDFAEYHGSLVSWVVLTHTIAKGILEQGYPRIAQELWTRMLCAIIVSNQFQEFFYFDEQGQLFLSEHSDASRAKWLLRAEDNPQNNQAWTISAVIEAVEISKTLATLPPISTNEEFENLILSKIKQYRHQPFALIDELNQNLQYYHLEQVAQLAGAHEVDLESISNDKAILSRTA